MGRQNLKSFIAIILKKHTDQALIKNISFEVDIDENLDVLIDSSAFGIIMSNFITNALKHSPASSTVIIKNDLTDDFNSRLSVIDSGRGIPKKYRQRVFERFFRVDRGRAKQSGGTGLDWLSLNTLPDLWVTR